MAYDYGYTTNSFGSGPCKPEFTRLCQATPQYQYHQHRPHQLQDQRGQAQQAQWQELQRGPPFAPYDPSSLYSSNQKGPGQSAAHFYPQYMPFHTDDALSEPTFALPYTGSSTTKPFAATVPTDLTLIRLNLPARLEATPVHAQIQIQEQQIEKEPPRSLDEEYAKYGISLCTAFDNIRAGRLSDASRPLVEVSKWLVNDLQELGFLYADRADLLPLWNDFNNCWLALFQKQWEMQHDLVAPIYMPTKHSLLTSDRMEAMGNELIQLCDQLEPHGLVDYQMGIQEENILSVLGRCLDSMEQPLRAQTNARMTRRS